MTARRAIVALLALAAAVAAVAALTGVGAARSSTPKVVKVADNFYTPTKVKVHKLGKVKWQWPAEGTFSVHNVTLTSAPKGVKKRRFRSQTTGNPGFHFTKRFRKPGRYHFVCTIHRAEMQMNVVVKR
jgi:plastocyanin